MTLRNAFDGLATEPKQDAGNALLQEIRDELNAPLDVQGAVGLKVGNIAVDGAHPLPVAAVFADANGVPYGETNPLPTEVQNLTVENLNVAFPDSEVSVGNSSSTLLGAGETYIGPWEQVVRYSAISVIALADVASAMNGAVVDFSDDGVTPIRSIAATLPANTGLTFMFAPEARYFRLRYTNGPTQQGMFRAQTLLHYQKPVAPMLPLAAITTDVSLAESNIAHLKGRLSTGQWLAVAVASDGAVKVDGSAHTQPVSGTVALDATTLAALESVQAAVTGTVGLDPATLAALEDIVVSGTVALDATTLAALESVTAAVTGTVALDAATLAALESVTATVSGAVSITNLPSEYPLPAAQVSTLTPQTDGLTDAELRAAPVAVSDAQLDIALSVLRDALRGASSKTLTDVVAALTGQLNVTDAITSKRYAGGKSALTAAVSASGTTTLLAPPAGKRIVVYWVSAMSDPNQSSVPDISINLGAQSLYRVWAAAHWEPFTGAVDAPLTVTLDVGVKTLFTVHYELI